MREINLEGKMIFLCIKKSKVYKGFSASVVLLLVVLIVLVGNIYDVDVFQRDKRKLPIYSVDTKEKKVALTFDASWGQDNTEKIVQILDKYDVKATFFLVGAWVDSNPNKLKLLFDKGHEIGNHTNLHPNMNSISKEKLIKEIESADNKIKKIIGQGTTLFRAPSGDYNNSVIETIEGTNRYVIQWNVDSIDWKGDGADIEYNRVMKKTVPGSIILFHCEAIHTPDNLPKIIEALKEKGYVFTTVSQLIYKENFYIDENGKQIYNKNN
jgi:polysaccharide deacetylase family sporulation protein PdaB